MEKFILAEDIKHILNERFILNEALSFSKDDAGTLATNLSDVIKNNKLLQTSKANTQDVKVAKDLDTEIFILKGLLKSGTKQDQKDPAKIKGKCIEAIKKIEQILSQNTEFKDTKVSSELNTHLANFKQLAGNSDYSKDGVKKLQSTLDLISQAISGLKSGTGDTNEKVRNYIKALENGATMFTKLEEFLDGSPTLEADIEKAINTRFTTCHDAYNKYIAKPDDETALSELAKASNQSASDLKKILDSVGFVSKKQDNKTDWAARFKEAPDKNKFWDEYYQEAWGQNGNRVKALGEAFRNECVKLGFTNKTNPFLDFVQYFIIDKNWNINAEQYRIVHNTAAGNSIDIKDLKRATEASGTIINPIFCKDFYTKSSSECQDYLTYFARIKNLRDLFSDAKKAQGDEDYNHLITYLDQTTLKNAQFVYVILFDVPGASFDKLTTEDATAPIKAADISADGVKLRDLTEIDALIRVLSFDTAGGGMATKPIESKALIEKIKLAAGTDKNIIALWLHILIMSFLLPADGEKIYKDAKYAGLVSAVKAIGAIDPVQELDIKKQIYDLGNKISEDKIRDVIDNLGVELKIDWTK